MDFDLESMSRDELVKLKRDVTKALDDFDDRSRKDALATVEAKAAELGFTLAQLLGGTSKKAKAASPAKYRHPDKPEQTWSGRGRQPAWIREAEAAGRSRDDFLI